MTPTGMLPCEVDRLAVYEPADAPRWAAWLVVAIVTLVALACSGCVTRSEYRAFVGASRGFFDSVAPVFSEKTLADEDLSDQSKKNRLELLRAYDRALKAAEERSR